MSAVIKTNRTRKLPVSAPALWIVLGLAASLFLVRYWQQVLQEHSLDEQIVLQSRSNQQMLEENQRLALERERAIAPDKLAPAARRLGLQTPRAAQIGTNPR